MSKEQTRLYDAIANHRVRDELEAMGWTSDGTDDPRGNSAENKTTRLSNTMMQARKVCCHPYLFGEPLRKRDAVHTDERIISTCGKLQVLDRMLQRLHAAGHRVLIFSQFVRVLEILEDYFLYRAKMFGGDDCFRVYHGGMKGDEKEDAVADYQVPIPLHTLACSGVCVA